jgi:hypothetical protein
MFRNEVDEIVTLFRKSNPDFYNGSSTARIVIDRAATRPAKAPEPSAAATSPTPSPTPPK